MPRSRQRRRLRGITGTATVRAQLRRTTNEEPTDIAAVDPNRAGFVPRNQRGGATGWTRNNADALPRSSQQQGR